MNPANSYRESEIASADGVRLVLMSYDGAMGFLLRARAEFDGERWREGMVLALRAKRVVMHLTTSLDLSAGDVAVNLQRLYGYCLERIAVGMQTRKGERLDEAAAILRELRGAWCEATARPARRDEEASVDISVSA